jgi:hypothetical protein
MARRDFKLESPGRATRSFTTKEAAVAAYEDLPDDIRYRSTVFINQTFLAKRLFIRGPGRIANRGN